MMTHDQMIEVIQAHKDGKVIESQVKRCPGWMLADAPVWNFEEREYRVKPEPREFWINRFEDKFTFTLVAHESRNIADSCSNDRVECVHVREVMEEA